MVYAARPARTSPVSCMPTCLKLLLASAALAAEAERVAQRLRRLLKPLKMM